MPVPLGLMNASTYNSIASQFRLTHAGEFGERRTEIDAVPAGLRQQIRRHRAEVGHLQQQIDDRGQTQIEPKMAKGMLRPGLRASPARFTGLWKPLKLKTMPAVATAVSTAAKSMTCAPPLMPT